MHTTKSGSAARLSSSLRPAAAAFALVWAGAAAAQSEFDRYVQHVNLVGADGGQVYYDVRCVNGIKASVALRDADNNTCVRSEVREQTCRPNWTIRDAAISACK